MPVATEAEAKLRSIEEDLGFGVEIETTAVESDGLEPCGECGGSGYVEVECMECGGSGLVETEPRAVTVWSHGGIFTWEGDSPTCPVCGKPGQLVEVRTNTRGTCPECRGRGYVELECDECDDHGFVENEDNVFDPDDIVYDLQTWDGRYWNHHGEHCGHEFVSPVMYGEQGIRDALTVARRVRETGDVPSRDTVGLHVHVDAWDLKPDDVLWLREQFFRRQDDIYRSFGVWDCRERAYCHKLRYSDQPEISRVDDRWTVSRTGYNYRYQGLNLEALAAHGSIEFRLFNGMQDDKYVKDAIRFARRFVALAMLDWRPSDAEVDSLLSEFLPVPEAEAEVPVAALAANE